MLQTTLRHWLSSRLASTPDVPPPSALPPTLALTLAAQTPAPAPVAVPPAPPGSWTPGRIATADSLWGEGFLFPGGAAETLRLVLPLGLSEATTLLLLGAGLGGPAHTIAAELGGWVTAYEANPDLVALAVDRGLRAGLARRAPVELWDPAKPAFRAKYFKHALALEPLRGAVPATVIAGLADAIQVGGQLVLLATVADQGLDPADPETAAWLRLDPQPVTPPTEAQVTQGLARAGFDVRIAEDLSLHQTALAIAGWRDALRALAAAEKKLTLPRAKLLISEAELWLLRLRLIRTGRLRLLRWHAIRAAGKV